MKKEIVILSAYGVFSCWFLPPMAFFWNAILNWNAGFGQILICMILPMFSIIAFLYAVHSLWVKKQKWYLIPIGINVFPVILAIMMYL